MSVMPLLALIWTALCFGIYVAAWLPGFHPGWAGWFWTSPIPAPHAFLAAMGRHAAAFGWVAAVDAAGFCAGGPLAAWVSPPPANRDAPLRLILGLVVILPLAALGLGLAGLLRPGLLVTATLATAVPGGCLIWRSRPRAVPPFNTATVVLAGLLLLPSLLRALAPQIEYDALRYHFALPHGYLLSGTIVPGEPRPLCHLPLGAEMLLGLGMAGGGDGGALLLNWQWLPLLLWLAFRCARTLGFSGALAHIGWVALAASPLFSVLGGGGFTDLFACVAVAAALRLALERRPGNGIAFALLIGAAGAAKFSMVPLGLAWLVPMLFPFRPGPVIAAWMAPLAPWFAKNWLFTGSPFGGIALTNLWPAFDQHESVTQLYRAARWIAVGDPATWLSLPRFLMHDGVTEGHEVSPLVAIALPALAVGWNAGDGAARRSRRAVLAVLAAWAGVGGGQVRYLAPLLLPVVLATSAAWFTPSRALLLGAAALGWVRIAAAGFLSVAPLPVVLGAVPRLGYLMQHVAPRDLYMEAGTWLAGHPEAGRAYVAGDIKAYYWPGTPLVDAEYNLPFLYTWARDARDADRLAVAFRQRGIGCLVHRVEGALTYQQIAGGYPWDDRTLRVLQTFLLTRTAEVWRRERPENNAFYRIRIVQRPPSQPGMAGLHWLDLPYTELLTQDGDRLIQGGRLREARAAYAVLARRFPSWIIPRLRLAETAHRLGDRAAERRLEREARALFSREALAPR